MKHLNPLFALFALFTLFTFPSWAGNPDSITITVNITTALSVNIENNNFTHGTNKALGDEFRLAQTEVLSIDNDSGATTSGLRETYQLSAAVSSPSAWTLSSADVTAGADDVVLLAVFSSAGSLQPATTEFNSEGSTGDLVTTTAKAATSTEFYGTGSSTNKSGVQVVPASGSERNLWLMIKLPTTSSQTGNFVFLLYVNATAA